MLGIRNTQQCAKNVESVNVEVVVSKVTTVIRRIK